MTARIRANRLEVTDRFPVLGFTIRTDGPPQRAEVAIAVDPLLFRQEHKVRRTTGNFYSSRAGGPLVVPRGEAVYVVPPEVLARFVGQDRLYVALATIPEQTGAVPRIEVLPGEGSPYISLKNLSKRSLKRVRMLPSLQRRAAGYATDGLAALEWWGDTSQPGMEKAPGGPAAGPVQGTTGNGVKERAQAQTPAEYDDGFGPMPPTTTPTAAVPPPAAPIKTKGEPEPATSQGNARGRGLGVSSRPSVKPFLVEPYYDSSSWWDSLRLQIEHFARGAMWFLGVADTMKPPYAAICQVRRPDGTEEGVHLGTAFFIAPRLLLTAAHVVDGQSELIIVPGKNGGGISSSTEPLGRFRVTQFQKHGSYGVSGRDNDMALICVPAGNAASAPNYFGLVEELMESRPEGVVVSGYAAWWYATSAIEEFVNQNIDENRQHVHGGHIRELPTEGTFTYDLQTLAGTSGSPVYWIEEGPQPRAHLVGVHVAAHDNKTNLGCRITQEKLAWIRATAATWGQTLTFSMGMSGGAKITGTTVAGQEDPDSIGIGGDEPEDDALAATSQGMRVRAFDTPLPDYAGASRFAPAHSVNYTAQRRSGIPVDRIVIHITAGGPKIDGTIAWFQNGDRFNERTGKPIRSSAHYIVGRDGEVVQMVRNAHTAHHASGSNWRSIGIEHNANKPTKSNPRDLPPTEPQYESSARLAAWLCAEFGIPTDREHIVGHAEASPQDNHDCPSSYWDWDRYMELVRAAASAGEPEAQSMGALSARVAERDRQKLVSRALVVGLEDRQKARKHGPSFKELFQWAVPASVARAIESRGFKVQTIDAAVGDLNLDRYPVAITRFPQGWDAARLLQHFIRNINQFVDTGLTEFTPYDESDAQRLASGNPITTVFKLNILGPDNAAIVISAAEPQFYIVSTINTPWSGDHPVSGHRQFGYIVEDGKTTFYTRGADRATLGFPGTESAIFYAGEKLWESFQSKLAAFINDNGGVAKIMPPFSERFNATAMRQEFGHFDLAQSLTAEQAMSSGAFTVNWDEVELVPQPTDVSCWATAAAMVVGWKDRISLSPETITQITGRTTATGLDPAQVEQFAGEVGLVFEYPQCYTVEGFRRLLETKGPLWVGAAVPSLHVIVVTGLYKDGTNTFVRITDPWDRQVGTPGAPGTYLNTHSTGSRYIMRWEDFVREYETAPLNYSGVNLQILHSGGTGGRLPNSGTPSPPPGYAQSLAARSAALRAQGASRLSQLPPAPRALSFGAPIASARRRVTGSTGGVSWELDQYDGMKTPAGMAVTGALAPVAGPTITLSDWPYIECPSGRTYATVVIDWRHEGGMVGDVQTAIPTSGSYNAWTVRVTAGISDGPDTAAVAALRIMVRYEFGNPDGSRQVAVTDITLYGDGRYERQNRWEMAAQPVAA